MISIVCSTCGSDEVNRDAWAEWDEDRQEWVLSAVFDNGYCQVCEGDSRLKEVPLKKRLEE